jgi:phosphoribosylanthranilate isomerase
MKVKICGVTNLEDALAAAEAGADLLGFNFYPPSPRYITPRTCRRIVRHLKQISSPVRTVGVFVNAPVERMRDILDECSLDLAQLSGDEPPEILEALDGRGFKAIRPESLVEARKQAGRFSRMGGHPSLLLDACHPNLYGGTGKPGNWELAQEISRSYSILLAGGLHPGNLTEAIVKVRPWGVDVASGIESSPGRKDHQKLLAFIQTARQVTEEAHLC